MHKIFRFFTRVSRYSSNAVTHVNTFPDSALIPVLSNPNKTAVLTKIFIYFKLWPWTDRNQGELRKQNIVRMSTWSVSPPTHFLHSKLC